MRRPDPDRDPGPDPTAGEGVRRELARLVRERLARRPGGHLIESQLRDLELRLPLPVGDGADGFARRLVAAIDELLDDAVQQAAAFRPGHVWCHRCTQVACEHSRPPSSRQVFVGYTPTGVPRWQDFAQLCLERRHPRVEQLYADPPALLVLLQDAAALRGKMLAAFDEGASELAGQIVAGFFPVRARADEGRGVLAITIQVAASRGRRGGARLGLNLLGRAPSGGDLEALWERQDDLPWRRSVRWAQAALRALSPAARRPGPALAGRVERLLQALARRLEREQRARGRRTHHAELRHASGERPTRKALDDARTAPREMLFVDERSGAIVVLGERGRTHFFTADGRLVSSARYGREAIGRKVKVELWRPAPDELVQRFRSKLPQ